MDAEASNKYLKFSSTPELSRLDSDLVNNVKRQETESDGEEDLSGSTDSSSNAVRKRSSPVYVYTYKVSNQYIYYSRTLSLKHIKQYVCVHTLTYIHTQIILYATYINVFTYPYD